MSYCEVLSENAAEHREKPQRPRGILKDNE